MQMWLWTELYSEPVFISFVWLSVSLVSVLQQKKQTSGAGKLKKIDLTFIEITVEQRYK